MYKSPRPSSRSSTRLAGWGIAFALACILIGYGLYIGREPSQEKDSNAVVPGAVPEPESPPLPVEEASSGHPSESTVSAATSAEFWIQANVISRDLLPESGVVVTAVLLPDSTAIARKTPIVSEEGHTDSEGHCVLPVSVEGTFHIRATKDTRAAETLVRVSEGFPATAHLVLAPAGSIGGKVVNAAGKPVSGARVSLSRKNHMQMRGASTQSGADGRFEFTSIPPGIYRFMAEAEGYAPAESETVEPGAPEITIGLTPGGRIVGHVLDVADGRPVTDFPVAARALEGERNLPPVTSDATGRFAFENLSDDSYLVFGVDTTRVVVPGPSRVSVSHGRAEGDVELRVTNGARITGVVYGEASGAPISGVRVETVLLAEDRGITDTTDDEGVYVLDGVSPGHIRVGFSFRGSNRSTDIEVPEGAEEVLLDFAWPDGVRVAGMVLDASGVPVLNAEVVLESRDMSDPASVWTMRSRTGAGGAFIIEDARSGDGITIRARSEQGRSPVSEPFSIPPGGLENLVVQLSEEALATASGIVVDGREKPVLAHIRMTRLSSDPTSDVHVRESAFSEADGYFLFRSLPAGEYAMEVGPMDKPSATLATPFGADSVSLRPGENRTGLRVVLDSGGEIRGTITDEVGTPLYRAEVWLFTSDNSFPILFVTTDSFGAYTLRGVGAGMYGVGASMSGYERTTFVGAHAGDVVDLVLGLSGGAEAPAQE